MTSPNIVWFCTDMQIADSLGCAGNPLVSTPNLDALARSGTRFTRHLAPSQMCAPSRSTMFTGLFPRNHRLVGNGMALDTNLPTLPGILANAGYRTHAVGKLHLQPTLAPAELAMPESVAFWRTEQSRDWTGPYYGLQGAELVIGVADETTEGGHYARWLEQHHPEAAALLGPNATLAPAPPNFPQVWKCAIPPELHYNTWIADRAGAFIEHAEGPFFLFVSFPDPHHPFSPQRPYCDRHDPAAMLLPRPVPGELDRMPAYYRELPWSTDPDSLQRYYQGSADDIEQGFLVDTTALSEHTLRQVIAHYLGTIEMIDASAGRVLEVLRARGLEEETIIVFTSDHGWLNGDHGLQC